MKCPICKLATGIYYWPATYPPAGELKLIRAGKLDPKGAAMECFDYPLYQRSYPSESGYISPRYDRCYNKAERKLIKKG